MKTIKTKRFLCKDKCPFSSKKCKPNIGKTGKQICIYDDCPKMEGVYENYNKHV